MTSQNGGYHVTVEFENQTRSAAQVMVAHVQFKGQSSWEPAASANDTFKCMDPLATKQNVLAFQTVEVPAKIKYRVAVFAKPGCRGAVEATLESADNLYDRVPVYTHRIMESKNAKGKIRYRISQP
jgi:hypothetical protein